jgi:pimeloyl-ACP methyl ester carboxylesterase
VALLRPDRIGGLAVLDIAPVQYTDDEPHWKAVVEIINTLSSTNLQPGMSKRDVDIQLQSAIADPALRAFCLTNYDQKSGKWNVNINSIASQLETLAGFDLQDAQVTEQQYTGDSFFIHGGQSRFVRLKHIDTIAQYFPNHMLTTIRGAGHWVHAEAPEDTTALLKKFLDR